MSITHHRHEHGAANGRRFRARVLVMAFFALAAAGCSQTATQATTESVLTGPLVLAPAPAGAVSPGGTSSTSSASSPSAAPDPMPSNTASATPTPSSSVPLRVNAIQAELAETRAAGGEFPNVNKPPLQPGGTLLAPDARAQIISELEALRSRQPTPGGGGNKPSELAAQAQTHGEAAIRRIEECSADGALENDPACAAD